MKKFILLLIISILSSPLFAQLEVKEDSFKEVAGFVIINTEKMYDDNDKPYAVLKIKTVNISSKERRELNFGGDAQTFFEVEYKDGEVWLYISYYATFIKISHEEYSSTEFYFPFDMKPKCGYELTLINKKYQQSDEVGYITVKTVPSGADVMIDNKKVGVTPYLLESISVGNHKISVSMDEYEPMAKRVDIETGKENEVFFNLVTKQYESKDAKSSNDNKIITVNGISFEMVAVKGGTFIMGGTSEQGVDAEKSEKPLHKVALRDYYIGKYEVTQELWYAVMGKNPSKFKGDKNPVENISWNDVQKFIKKLNTKTKQHFRLPTEAEWEYAARGGEKTNGYKYSGGRQLKDVAWYSDNSNGTTHLVGQKLPNELGIYDMSGNVWEWCQDWFGNYNDKTEENPTGPVNGKYRITRGGGWNYRDVKCRISTRNSIDPNGKYDNLGLRLVSDVVR